MSAVEQGKEVGLAMLACGDQFAVDDVGLCREPQDGRSDAREAARKVSAIPPIDSGRKARLVQLNPVPVKFQFVEPSAGKLSASAGREG
jgi:hypothetical protein